MSLRNAVEYVIEKPEEMVLHKPYYALHKDGVYRYIKKDAMIVKELFSKGETDIPLLTPGEVGFEYHLPKMPMSVYLTILNFYKAVYAQDNTEASCHVFYLHEGQTLEIPEEYEAYSVGVHQIDNWVLYCPQQTNHATLTSFREDEFYPYLRKHYTIMMETHSHHTMNAFWSGTDNANQKDPILYGVFGHINTEDKFLVKFVWQGENINIEPEMVVDYPQLQATVDSELSKYVPKQDLGIYKGKFNYSDDFPKQWLTKCHKVSVTRFNKDYFGHSESMTNGFGMSNEKPRKAYQFQSSQERQSANTAIQGARVPSKNEKPLNNPVQAGTAEKKSVAENVESEVTVKEKNVEKSLPKPRNHFYN